MACLGLSFVALIATLVVSAVLPTTAAAGSDTSMTPNAFDDTAKQFALVVLFLTPFQAAGEEYAFRGYLTQAFGGLLPDLGRGRSGRRCCSLSRTAPRARRCSSTGSPSAWSPASSWSAPAGSRRASRCTC